MDAENPPLKRQMAKKQMEEALMRLGQTLRERRVSGEIAVFGGAAIVLGFEFRTASRDIDAVVTEGHGQVIEAAREVEKELHLPSNWLNEQATRYLSRHKDFAWFKTYPSEGQFGLRVLMAKAEYMLAMKLLAFRLYAADIDDIKRLAFHLKRTTPGDLLALLKYYYPDEQISPEREVQIRELAKQINAPPKP